MNRRPAASGGPPTSLFQHIRRVASRSLEGGRQAEQDARDERECRQEHHHAPVEADDRLGGEKELREQSANATEQPEAQHETADRAQRGEQDALGEELTNQAAAARAEGRAQRHFTRPQRRSRQQEIRQVGTPDHQHGADRGHHHHQRQTQLVADHAIDEAVHRRAPTLLDVGILLRDAGGNAAHLGLGALEAHAGLQPSDDGQVVEVAHHVRSIERKGHAHLRPRPIELATPRQHADDRVVVAVQRDRAPHDGRVAAELADPEAMAEHDDAIVAGTVFAGRERPADPRLHAQHVEVRRRHSRRSHLSRLAASGERERVPGPRGHGLERGRLIPPIEEVEGGDAVAQTARRLFPDLNDLVRLGIRQRLQQQPVHEAEDGDVRAQPEGQRQHRKECEPRILHERAPGVPQIGQPRHFTLRSHLRRDVPARRWQPRPDLTDPPRTLQYGWPLSRSGNATPDLRCSMTLATVRAISSAAACGGLPFG